MADWISRRGFLGMAAAGTLVTACTPEGSSPPPDGESEAPPPPPGEYRESPLLASRVEAGDLPPVQQRLPKEPFIVRPGTLIDDEAVGLKTGTFGGTLQIPTDPNFDSAIYLASVEPLLWTKTGVNFTGEIIGSVLAAFDKSDDATVFTLHLRDGLRWSDGEPVTIDDVKFAINDVLLNKEITPVFPAYLRAPRPNAPVPKIEYLDDRSFRLTFDSAYGSFPAKIALGEWRSYSDLIKPRHYLEQFHEKYADAGKLRQLIKDASIEDGQWSSLFNARQLTGGINISGQAFAAHPTLTAWILKSTNQGVRTFERNPYYFKIDQEGNQLPYIDSIRSQEVANPQTLISRTLFGEFDYSVEWMSLKTLPQAMDKVNAGESSVLVSRLHRSNITFWLNHTHPNKNWRAVVGDVRFRQALSLAMNRQEIIDDFYLGQFAQLPTETNPSEYDVDKANALLDDMGMDRKDGAGFRLGPDGKRFTVPIEFYAVSEDHAPMSELMAEYWKAVGVYTTVKLVDGALWHERSSANEIYAGALFIPHDLWHLTLFSTEYLPLYWGTAWNEWYNNGGKGGEEPPQPIKDLFDAHDRFMAADVGTPESDAAYQEIMANHRENLWVHNPVEHVYYPCMWTKKVKNIPSGIKKEVFGIIGNISMEQWYLEE